MSFDLRLIAMPPSERMPNICGMCLIDDVLAPDTFAADDSEGI
jgi:hypothetical protein